MTSISFSRGLKSAKPVNPSDGSLLLFTDTEELFLQILDATGGYRNDSDGLFYEEDTYDTAIAGVNNRYYKDLATGNLYKFNGSAFVASTDKEEIKITDFVTVAALSNLPTPGTEISNKFYYVTATNSLYKVINNAWTVIGGGGGSSYSEGAGITISNFTIKAKIRSETALNIDSESAAAAGTSGRLYPVQIDNSGYLAVNVPWVAGQSYSQGTGISINANNEISLAGNVVAAGSEGPAADVTGSDGATIVVPKFTVDEYGRVTAHSYQTLTCVNTTYSTATQSTAGLMSSSDKTLLDNIGQLQGVTSDPASTSTGLAASAYLTNYLAGELKFVTLATNNWSSGTTTVNGKAYHTCTKNVTKILVAHPIMFLNVASLPTDAQNTAWSGLFMVANTANNVLTFYSESVPAVSIPVGLKGVV